MHGKECAHNVVCIAQLTLAKLLCEAKSLSLENLLFIQNLICRFELVFYLFCAVFFTSFLFFFMVQHMHTQPVMTTTSSSRDRPKSTPRVVFSTLGDSRWVCWMAEVTGLWMQVGDTVLVNVEVVLTVQYEAHWLIPVVVMTLCVSVALAQ